LKIIIILLAIKNNDNSIGSTLKYYYRINRVKTSNTTFKKSLYVQDKDEKVFKIKNVKMEI